MTNARLHTLGLLGWAHLRQCDVSKGVMQSSQTTSAHVYTSVVSPPRYLLVNSSRAVERTQSLAVPGHRTRDGATEIFTCNGSPGSGRGSHNLALRRHADGRSVPACVGLSRLRR